MIEFDPTQNLSLIGSAVLIFVGSNKRKWAFATHSNFLIKWDEEIWPRIEDKAENLWVVLQPARRAERAERLTMGANTPGTTRKYFKRTIAIPILYRVSQKTGEFSDELYIVFALLYLPWHKGLEEIREKLQICYNSFSQILIKRSTQEVKADLDEALEATLPRYAKGYTYLLFYFLYFFLSHNNFIIFS